MVRYIDADDFLDLFYVAAAGQDKAFIETVEMVLDEQPTADVVEVKHGRWIPHATMEKHPYARNHDCSKCGYSPIEVLDYCPKCGAKMDGGDAE